MGSNILEELPFHKLKDEELTKLFCLSKPDIFIDHSCLKDYVNKLTNSQVLEDLNLSYVTETQFNERVKNICSCIEFAIIHLNIRSLNCNHRALCQF